MSDYLEKYFEDVQYYRVKIIKSAVINYNSIKNYFKDIIFNL